MRTISDKVLRRQHWLETGRHRTAWCKRGTLVAHGRKKRSAAAQAGLQKTEGNTTGSAA